MRREFVLPAEDMEWLEGRGHAFELVLHGSIPRVIVYELPVPPGFNQRTVTANVRIEPGYPEAQIDMVYFYPDLSLASGRAIGALSPDAFDGKTWQRWSRHRTPINPWRPGIDNLSTHFAQVQEWLEREARKA